MIIVTRDGGVLQWREEGENVTGTYPSEELAQGRMDVLIVIADNFPIGTHALINGMVKYPQRCTEPEDGLILRALPAGSLIHTGTGEVLLLTRVGEEWGLVEYSGGEVDVRSYSG